VEEFAVLQTLAHYVRAADYRDGAAMAALFLPEGRVVIGRNEAGRQVAFATLEGREAISHAVTHMMQPHPAHGWSHHTTHDPIVVIDGDRATIDALCSAAWGNPSPQVDGLRERWASKAT
jgi:SnoaL-like domain